MLINLTQGSEEWHNFRKGKIGASQTAAILGFSPWHTPLEMYELIKGLRDYPPPSPSMIRGLNREQEAREIFEKIMGQPFFPICAIHDEYPFLIASLDGISLDHKFILEIKWSDYTYDEVKKGKIPKHYEIQCLQQLACVPEAECVYFMVMTDHDYAVMKIDRDEERIKELIQSVQLFHVEHLLPEIPPPLTENDYLIIDDDSNFEEAVQEWKEANIELKIAQENASKARAKLLNFTDDGNTMGYGVKLQKMYQTNVDYKKACLDAQIDLTPYQKERIVKWRITEMKDD